MFKRSLYSVSIRGAEVSLHFQGWLLQIIYGSFTYKLDCCNTGGLKTWGHSANLHLCAFTLEHSVQGSLPWCPLTIPWVQCSAEAFTNRKGTAVVCEKCDLQYSRAWVGFGGRTLMFSQKLILDMVLECPDRVSVSDHCLWISFFSPACSLFAIADGSAGVERNTCLMKGCRPLQQGTSLLLKLFRAPMCVCI